MFGRSERAWWVDLSHRASRLSGSVARRVGAEQGVPDNPQKAPRLPFAVCLIAVAILVSGTVRNSFVSLDDPIYVFNPWVRGGLSLDGLRFALLSVTELYWHPMAWLSHELDFTLFGMQAMGHHLSNAILQIVATGLLYLVLRELKAGPWAACAGALLWAAHPLRVESYAWVAERKDVLCACFFTATILAYLRFQRRPTRWKYWVWVLSGALTLMTKPVAVCLVPILLLMDWWPRRRPVPVPKLVLEKTPLVGLTALVAVLTVYGQSTSGATAYLAAVPSFTRLANGPIFYMRYIAKMLWPLDLACFYPYDPHPSMLLTATCTVILVAITVGAAIQRRDQPWLLVGWLWFVVALIPNIGLIQAGRQSIADRFTNIAMVGPSIAVALTGSSWVNGLPGTGRRLVQCAVGGALLAFALISVHQVSYWKDSVRLFEHAIRVEDSDFMRGNLATALLVDRKTDEALIHIQLAARHSPESWDLRNNYANILMQAGQIDLAAVEATAAFVLAPQNPAVVQTLAMVRFKEGNSVKSLELLNQSVVLGARKGAVAAQLNDMGASLASRGKPKEAEPIIRRALELDGTLVQAWRNLVLLLADQGRVEEAVAALTEAVKRTGRQPAYRGLVRGYGED